MKPIYINGKREISPFVQKVVNPWDGVEISEVCLASEQQVDEAVEGARGAFERTRRQTASHRVNVLESVARLIGERREEFVSTIVAEAGKPVLLAEAEVERARLAFRFAAAEVMTTGGQGLAVDASAPGAGHLGVVRRFPIGVILGITPFNFPLNLVAHKVAPCLASGNCMVVKPSPKTPLSALLLAEVLETAGVFPGQINVVPFDISLVPRVLQDPRIKMVSFTGSVAVGWDLKAAASRMKVALELGGNAAVIIEPDSDWPAAISSIAAGAFGAAGQSCISVQRIMVHEEIYEDFRQALVAYIRDKVPVGDPCARSTLVGPMIDPMARDRIIDWIQEAEALGARTLTPLRPEGHSLLWPVLLEDVPAQCRIVCEEAFAPVAVLEKYSRFEDALARVNASAFGLQAGVFTPDLGKALLAYEELEVGSVLIGQIPTFRVENMPYGGVKASGFGREGIRYAIEEMTELRSLIIRRA